MLFIDDPADTSKYERAALERYLPYLIRSFLVPCTRHVQQQAVYITDEGSVRPEFGRQESKNNLETVGEQQFAPPVTPRHR